jgi:hypothetical protein
MENSVDLELILAGIIFAFVFSFRYPTPFESDATGQDE